MADTTATVSASGSMSSPLNTEDRQAVVEFFQSNYSPFINVPLRWSGDLTNCVPGVIDQDHLDATIFRVNYYRAMAGLPCNVVPDAALNLKCQEAALMMSAKGALSHAPNSEWPCYSSDGAEAAARSNLYLGRAGAEAIDGYIDDPGTANYFVGHRRWILYPPQRVMGSGSTPQIPYHLAANSLWVIGNFGSRPSQPEWVSWPPKGYVPFQILPRRSTRWSFSYPSADFANSSVIMQHAGTNVSLTLERQENRGTYADNTIVWKPEGITYLAPDGDTTFSVTVSNVVISGIRRMFSYNVTVIDPGISPPTLTFGRSGTNISFSWPLLFSNAILEVKQSFNDTWTPLGGPAVQTNGLWLRARHVTNATEYYRLRQP